VRGSVCVENEERMIMVYSEEFKKSQVRRMSGVNGISANALSGEIGVSQGTLSRWLRLYGSENGMWKKKKALEAEEKLKIVLETASLSESELGEYQRKNGVHSAELERWREEALSGLRTEKRGRPKVDPELKELREERKSLKR